VEHAAADGRCGPVVVAVVDEVAVREAEVDVVAVQEVERSLKWMAGFESDVGADAVMSIQGVAQ